MRIDSSSVPADRKIGESECPAIDPRRLVVDERWGGGSYRIEPVNPPGTRAGVRNREEADLVEEIARSLSYRRL